MSKNANYEYSARLTGNPFLFFETKIVAERLLRGAVLDALSDEILSGNLFQYKSLKSIPKRVHTIYKRLLGLDQSVLRRLVEGTAQDGKVITLFAIARSDRLFQEFLGEVIHPKLRGLQEKLTDRDVRRFFEAKAEISLKVATLSESSRKKLSQIYLNILLSVGILNSRKDGKVQRIILESEFRSILLKSFPADLVQLVEG